MRQEPKTPPVQSSAEREYRPAASKAMSVREASGRRHRPESQVKMPAEIIGEAARTRDNGRVTKSQNQETSPTRERAYRVRAHPTKAQQKTLAQIFGARRFVWNWALDRRSRAYRERKDKLNSISLSRELTELRNQPQMAWLKALPREPLMQALRDLDRAYVNFFKQRARYPRFKRKTYAGATRFTLDQRRSQVDRESGRVQLDGVGKLRFRLTEPLIGRLRSMTVSRDSAGRYFASFTADQVPAAVIAQPVAAAVGIDQGVKDLIVTSTNERTPASRALLVRTARLRRYQRSQSRKLKAAMKAAGLNAAKPLPTGTRLPKSKRFERNRIRIARLHARTGDARQDLLHQATARLLRRHALIAIETLSVKGMQRGLPRLRRKVANACMGELRRQLSYKCAWSNRQLILIDRFFPSSQLCSGCGWRNEELTLSDRRWVCTQCGAQHDRDHNAAKNILVEALRVSAANAASYPEERGKSRAGSVADTADEFIVRRGLDTLNRELIAKPAERASQRRARRDRAKAMAG